jgi:putative hydrolase of the HAD superfamily
MASEPEAGAAPRTALLVDWGGVLTTNLFVSFGAFCEQEGLEPDALAQQFRRNPEGRALLIAFEEGRVEEPEFERSFAALLGVSHTGLIDRLFAGVAPDEAMVGAVRAARAAGLRTGLISNSWGTRRYPREVMEDLFDGIVISGEVGMRKPAPEMYVLGAERAGVAPSACVYVDDLPFNLPPAAELGMATVHHVSAAETVPELERILGVALGGPAAGDAPDLDPGAPGAVGSGR